MAKDRSFCCLVAAEVHTAGECTSGLVQPRLTRVPQVESSGSWEHAISAASALGPAELLHAD